MAETDLDRELDELLQQIRRLVIKHYERGAQDMRARLINALDVPLPHDEGMAAATQAPMRRTKKPSGGRKRKLAELIRRTYTSASGQTYTEVIKSVRATGETEALDASIRNEMRRMLERGRMIEEYDIRISL